MRQNWPHIFYGAGLSAKGWWERAIGLSSESLFATHLGLSEILKFVRGG